MRAHLNERAKNELFEIMATLNETSVGHTLNKLISKMHKEIVEAYAHKSEVNLNESSCKSENH